MLAMFALFLLLPAVLPRFGYTYLGTEVMIWAIFALGYNLLLGYTGLPAFGHGAFFGIGGYLLGMSQKWVTGGLALPLAAAAWGRSSSAPSSRSSSPAGAASTSRSSRSPSASCSGSWSSCSTPGPVARTGSPASTGWRCLGYALRDNVPFYYFVYAWFVGATIVLWRIVNSPFGQVIRAIRQSETRARAVGYDTARYKWAVFTLSCGFAGLAGGLYALARFGAFAEPMSLSQSGNVVLMCLIGGGFASFYGPVLGVVVFLALRDVLSTLTDHWMLAYGILFMAVILFMPEGILGVVRRLRQPAGFHDTGAAAGGPRARVLGARFPGRARARRAVTDAPATHGATPVLETRGLRKAFGGHVVLDGVDLTFERRPALGPDRAERGGQDDVLQPPDRLPRRRRGRDPLQGAGRHAPAAAPPGAPGNLPVVPGPQPLRRRHGARERAGGRARDAGARLRLLEARRRRERGGGPGRRGSCA